MRIFSRLRITAFAAATVAALALGACATDDDLAADPTAADDSALIQQDQTADEAPAAEAEAQAVASSLVLSASCPCSGTYARCSGEATGGSGSYVIKFHNSAGSTITIPNNGGFFSFGTGMNHGSLKISASSGGATVTRTYNVSCTNPGPGPGPGPVNPL
jgi:hypothetical protein